MRYFILIIVFIAVSIGAVFSNGFKKVKIPALFSTSKIIYDDSYLYFCKYGIFKTSDWGVTVESLCTLHTLDDITLDMKEANCYVNSIFKATDGTLLASVKDHNIIYSHNDGMDWYESELKTRKGQHFYEYGDSLFLVNEGELYYSTDKGESWELLFCRQHVDQDKTKECYILNDTLYLIRKESQYQEGCTMTISDLKNIDTYAVNTEVDIDYLYSYNDELCAYNYLSLYKQTKNNKWIKTVNLQQKMQELFDNTNEMINPLTFMSDGDLILFGFYTEASVPSAHMEYAISWDNGENWTLVNWNKHNDLNTDLKVIDGLNSLRKLTHFSR